VNKIEKTDDILDKIKGLLDQNNFHKAYKILIELTEDCEQPAEIYYLLGRVFLHRNEINKSKKAFQKALEIDPFHTDSSISLSIIYNDTGDYVNAQKVYQSAFKKVKSEEKSNGPKDRKIDKTFSIKHEELAYLYLSYGRLDESLDELQKADILDPGNFKIKLKISQIIAKKGHIHKAIEEVKKLKNEFPNIEQIYISLGVMYFSIGNIIEAQNEWNKALVKWPSNNDAKMYLDLSRSATETNLGS
jgi:tetratricopeptide (TPR) repeat protein